MSERLDQRLAAIARRQHGAFNRRQARTAGFTARMIDHRLTTGAWLRLDTGVYALASHRFSWERQAMAATLAVDDAALSGRSAAALRRVEGFPRGGFEIMVPRTRNGTTRLAKVRHSDFMQVQRVDGIPCLTVAHTILSLTGRVNEDVLDRAIDDVLARRWVSIEELQDRFVPWARSRRPGVGQLRSLLAARGDAYVPPSSELERRLRSFLSAPGLPEFAYEHELPWWPPGQGRVDAYQPDAQLIIEADGRAWHTRERDFALDRRRDNLATANGHATLRFTFVDLDVYPDENRALLDQTLDSRVRAVITHT
jgi:very-short-patch-repair endonuclease